MALTSLFRQAVAATVAIAFFAGLGIYAIRPPSAEEVSKECGFSVDRASADVKEIAREPHPVGSVAHDDVLAYLTNELSKLPFDIQIQSASDGSHLTNVLARPRKSSGTNIILLVAHYDSVRAGPGAADDGAGVATLLETARVLSNEPSAKNEVAYLFTDGEERGLLGARAFAEDNPDFLMQVRLVLNFDARGDRGPVVMFETGSNNLALMRFFRKCPFPVSVSFAEDVYRRMPNGTDFTVFRMAGLTGYNFALIMGVEAYHQPGDTWENMDPRSLAHYGSYATTLAGRLAGADLDSLSASEDGIYFPLIRGTLVVYPKSWAMPLALEACLFYMVTVVVCARRRRLGVVGVLLGTVYNVLGVVIMGFLAVGVLGALRSVFDQSHRLGIHSANQFALVAVVVTGIATLAIRLALGRKFGAVELFAGALAVWMGLAVAVAVLMPGASYLFVWPAILGTAALCLACWRPATPEVSLIAMICSVAPACLMMAPVMMLAYYALLLGLLPVMMGLTFQTIFLVYVPASGGSADG